MPEFEEESLDTITAWDKEQQRFLTYMKKDFEVPLINCKWIVELEQFDKERWGWNIYENPNDDININDNYYINPSGCCLLCFHSAKFKTRKEARHDCLSFLSRNSFHFWKWKDRFSEE